jgi:Spy/CpxP family protein refolding chaperone
MKRLRILALAVAALAPAGATAQEAGSPYVDWQGRVIKALAPEDVAALLAGDGMGFALAAELNRYPGPRHVLDLADSLALTTTQRDAVEEIRSRMRKRAVELGAGIVAAEATLDSLFADASIDEGSLREGVTEIARLEGELRATHLLAHLETRAVLTEHQVARYAALRGYAPGDDHDAHVYE